MNPNITIIFQIINFFIGFFLLKHLLLKPAMKYLKSEKKKEEQIHQHISDQQNLVDKKIEKKKETWQKYQKNFQETCPPPVSKYLFSLKEERLEPEVVELSEKEIEQIAKHAQRDLIERMQRVGK